MDISKKLLKLEKDRNKPYIVGDIVEVIEVSENHKYISLGPAKVTMVKNKNKDMCFNTKRCDKSSTKQCIRVKSLANEYKLSITCYCVIRRIDNV